MRLMMGSETVKVIIVGATHAGTVAALQILALDPTVDVTVYERGSRLAFIGAGVPLYLSQQVTKIDELLNMDVMTLTHAGATMRCSMMSLKLI
jgi:2-polyprenyl-6-methoxyphenol hydroxylase-like FAD-dependent oxidoreductase